MQSICVCLSAFWRHSYPLEESGAGPKTGYPYIDIIPVAMKDRIQGLAHRAGVHLASRSVRNDPNLRRQRILDWLEVDLLLDVGANIGQYASLIRQSGYVGRIVSFEPQENAYRELSAAAESDPNWTARHLGLGIRSGQATINSSAISGASSILRMTQRHLDIVPQSKYVGTETIRLERLDDAAEEFLTSGTRIGLKMDVQGYELEVLRGGSNVLQNSVFVESEMALGEIYKDGACFDQLVTLFYDAGLRMASFQPEHVDPQTGATTWGDGIFVRDPSYA
jgi:FkbM family methyltransferase